MEQDALSKAQTISEVYKQISECVSILHRASVAADEFNHNARIILEQSVCRLQALSDDVLRQFYSLEGAVKSQILDVVLSALHKGENPSGLPIKMCSDYMAIHNLNPENKEQ